MFANELAAAETIIFVVSERFCVFAGEIAAAETTIFVVSERFCVAFALPKRKNYTYPAQSNLGQTVCHSHLIQFNFDQTVCQATSPQASSSVWIDENNTFSANRRSDTTNTVLSEVASSKMFEFYFDRQNKYF